MIVLSKYIHTFLSREKNLPVYSTVPWGQPSSQATAYHVVCTRIRKYAETSAELNNNSPYTQRILNGWAGKPRNVIILKFDIHIPEM
jgi:hypothetical protein